MLIMKANLFLTAAAILTVATCAFRAYSAPLVAELEATRASQQACAELIARSAQEVVASDIASL